MECRKYDIVIIGGGAAGLMAAAQACGRNCRVALLEKNRQCGRKLLITGKGRCNMTNGRPWEEFKEHIHPDAAFFRPAFMAFSNADTVGFFNSIGLATVEERGMRFFPKSGRSSDVRDVLESRLRKSGNVDVFYETEAISLSRSPQGVFNVGTIGLSGMINSVVYEARSVIVATGGLSYPATGSTGDGYRFAAGLGHTIVPTRPSLTALVPFNYNFDLVGLTLKNVALSLIVDGGVVQQEFGELTFTSGGLEGALGFRVSRKAVRAVDEGKKVVLELDLKPALTEQMLKDRIQREYVSGKKLSRYLEQLLPLQAVKPFMTSDQSLTVQNLPVRLKHWRFPVKGYVDYSRAVVTSGGVSLKEISRKTMESRLVPGLFFAGEVMDLDADTGGYNLQIAFSTGTAAINAAIAGLSTAQ